MQEKDSKHAESNRSQLESNSTPKSIKEKKKKNEQAAIVRD